MSSESDSQLIRRSVDTPSAFGELYDRHASAIHRYVARRLGVNYADDIMSETFLVAFERRATFDHTWEQALPWLFGIANTLMKKHNRVEARAWKGLEADSLSALPPQDLEELTSRVDAERTVRRLGRTLGRMVRRDRDVLLLYAWGDLDYVGIARALEIPVGTVRSRLNRARRLLRAEFNEELTQEVEDGRVDPAPQGA